MSSSSTHKAALQNLRRPPDVFEDARSDDAFDYPEAEDFDDARSIITELSNALDSEQGPPKLMVIVEEILYFLKYH